MRSKKPIVLLCLLLGAAGIPPLQAAEKAADANVTTRTLEAQTVLYAVVRGPYNKLGEAFGSLYSLLGSKGIKPAGPSMSVSLNNPETTASEHWLTEIRIPVDDSAKKLAGTLGPMTDVKTVPDMKVAVTVKSKGVSDPVDIMRRLYTGMTQNGYMPTGGPMQKIISDSQNHDYSQMVVEIMVPVMKAPSAAK
jgi:effector-binding domain-containing protein